MGAPSSQADLVFVSHMYTKRGRWCLCVFYVGPLCGPPLRWWVLCGVLPSVWVPCGRGPSPVVSPFLVPSFPRLASRSRSRSRSGGVGE